MGEIKQVSDDSGYQATLELDRQVAHPIAHDRRFVIDCADNLEFMATLDDQQIKLIVTSPPYNLGKEYEPRVSLAAYLESQERLISECVRVLHPQGLVLLASRQLRGQRRDNPA